MESSSRLRPYTEIVTFQKGEKVEAIWSTDGQKYPGTIVHVYPNDFYEILFNDGVKTRKKANQIFKLKKRSVRPVTSKNLSPVPAQVPATVTSLSKPVTKPMPGLISTNSSVANQPLEGANSSPQPQVPLSRLSNHNEDGDIATSSASLNSPQPAQPQSLPVLGTVEETTKTNSTILSRNNKSPIKINSITLENIKTVEVPISNTTPTATSNNDANSSDTLIMEQQLVDDGAGNTKKGFVYVKEPHYSVFDLPSTDLGKRRRRVHNYSMLAKGPSLKGKELLSNDSDEIDGESTSRPVSPVPPTVIPSLKSPPSIETSPAVLNIAGFTRRRRFLTSPPKTNDKAFIFSSKKATVFTKTDEKLNNCNESVSILKKSAPSISNDLSSPLPKTSPVPVTNSRSSSSSNSLTTCNTLIEGSDSESAPKLPRKDEVKSKLNSTGRIKTNNTTMAKIIPNLTPMKTSGKEQPNLTPTSSEIDEIPAKRSRRPTFKRFSEEEGYVDILSSRRNRRTNSRRSAPSSSSSIPNDDEDNETSPKLLFQRPRSIVRKPKSVVPVLDPETLQQNSKCKINSFNITKQNNCDPLTNQPGEENKPTKTQAIASVNHSKFVKEELPLEEESEEEELLDIDEYTVLSTEIPKKSSPRKRIPLINPSKSIRASNNLSYNNPGASKNHIISDSNVISPPASISKSETVKIVSRESPQKDSISFDTLVKPETNLSSAQSRVLRRRCGNRRWTMPSRIARASNIQSQPLPSVVLDRIKIPQVQIRVQKCDSILAMSSTSMIPHKSVEDEFNQNSSKVSQDQLNIDLEENESAITAGTSSGVWKHRRKRWGENKNRWTKQRNKIGLLPNMRLMRPVLRVNDSLSMQLIKRSRIQRRYEKRGRPKVALLTGITKKKLRKIEESMFRRKLKKKQIKAFTKFKDVRVDIINCICGRTDEFGLMVQCEVCLCWQHGGCFQINDGTMLPKFYVCQSCKSPKSACPSRLTEGIRQETYKKGVLPSYCFAPKPSEKTQKILQTCNELTKVIDGIDDIIRQNRIKEHIALSEPENPKLYQWSTPRATPKDRTQKWYFNKYYRSILRRLMLRHSKKPEYIENLQNIVGFREKLKTYSQALDETRSAISRKIGPRGLILMDKLSDHQKKLDKINKLKNQVFDESGLPQQKKKSKKKSLQIATEGQLVHDMELPPPPPPPLPKDSEDKGLGEAKTINSLTNYNNTEKKRTHVSFKTRLDKIISQSSDILEDLVSSSDSEDSSSYDDSDNSEGNCSKDETVFEEDETSLAVGPFEDWKEIMDCGQDIEPNLDQLPSPGKFSLPPRKDQKITKPITPEEVAAKLKEKPRKPRNIIEEPVEPKKIGEVDIDLIQVLSKFDPAEEIISGDVESDGTLSGNTTISAEDSEGGEEYWYNPIKDLNSDYESYRNLILYDTLVEDDKVGDPTWRPTWEDIDISTKDWKLDIESTLGLEDDSESESYDMDWSDSNSEFDESEVSSSDIESKLEEPVVSNEGTDIKENQENKIYIEKEIGSNEKSFWQKAILTLEDKSTTDEEEDPDWCIEDASEEISSCSSSDNEMELELSTSNEPINCTSSVQVVESHKPKLYSNGMKSCKTASSNSGVLLVTSDPDVKPGEQVRVCLSVSGNDETIGIGVIVPGNKGQNFIKLVNPVTKLKENGEQQINNQEIQGTTTSQQVPLCRSCRDSLGHKWNWNQLNNFKGIEVVCEETLYSYIEELKMYRQMGFSCTALNIEVGLSTKYRKKASKGLSTGLFQNISNSVTSPKTLVETNSSKPMNVNIPLGMKDHHNITSDMTLSGQLSSKPLQPASAEEESVLSLLSLSKTPVQFNGENVSELSIESLRKLTDRLQQNGPLTEDLAKAVGHPLLNGKIAFQNCNSYSNPLQSIGPSSHPPPDICVRCSLKGKTRKTLAIISTVDPELAKNLTEKEVVELYKEISEAVRQTRAVVYVIKRAVLNRIWKTIERTKVIRMALAAGQKISPLAVQRKIALKKPEKRLQKLRSEYVDALLPYATYFISRFTRKDELGNAKRTWVQDMIINYNKSKRALKKIFESENDEARLAKESKFYIAIDNLRKSFDIALTKKDIKLRRQNQLLSQNSIDQYISTQGSPVINNLMISSKPQIPYSNSPQIVASEDNDQQIQVQQDQANFYKSQENPLDILNKSNILVNGNGDIPIPIESFEVSTTNGNVSDSIDAKSAELEVMARLSQYPIQLEDVSAMLRITEGKMENDIKSNADLNNCTSENNAEVQVGKTYTTIVSNGPLNNSEISLKKSDPFSNGIGEENMEVDDIKLLEENLSLKASDNLDIGGDFDLINAIGTLGSSMDLKESEDSELLLNVFDDPVFSEPQEEPTPCCSKSLIKSDRSLPPKNIGPVLAKLTPEMCRGFLLDDIKSHQLSIDMQLDRVEAEIMELERRRGKGLREKDDDKLFEMLYANMQILIYNMEVLNRITEYQIGENDPLIEQDESQEGFNQEESGADPLSDSDFEKTELDFENEYSSETDNEDLFESL